MMETISILTVSVLPGLIYVCLGISLILKRRKETDEGENRTMSAIRKDYVVFLFVLALCFFSGLPALWLDDAVSESVAERSVHKLYLVSSALPCILIRRCDFRGRQWIQFYVAVALAAVLIVLTEFLLYSGRGQLAFNLLCRCAVGANLLVYIYVLSYICRKMQDVADESRKLLVKELLVHVVLFAFYNFFFLFYSFGVHAAVDYFIVLAGFIAVHATITVAVGRSMTLLSYMCPGSQPVASREQNSMEPLTAVMQDASKIIGKFSETKNNSGSQPLRERLLDYFESEKPYLSKTLTMEEVAMRLYTNKSYLSKTINMEMNKNFRELVNYFRVKEAINIFSTNTDISMNELRDRCGFNNNASFTSAFKLNTGYTPGEWCRDMKTRRCKAMDKEV